MPFRVEISPAAGRGLRHLPAAAQQRIEPAILSLADEPRPRGGRKVVGTEDTHRIRVGPYRVVYDIYDNERLVVILLVDRRSETTYRRV